MNSDEESRYRNDDYIKACHKFYDAWLEGKHPDIESLLERYPSHKAEIRSRVKKFMATYRYFEETRGERRAEVHSDEPSVRDGSGRTLGDFRLIREIGRGGMGVVYEARQISLDRTVALKVLPAHLTLQEKVVQRFQREAATAAKLKHPGIVEIYSVGEEDGHHYFAMEFVEGAPLDRVIASSNAQEAVAKGASLLGRSVRKVRHLHTGHEVPEEDTAPNDFWQKSHFEAVCRIIAYVAHALEYAHKAGVIHRDVKPSNILVREDGSIKLADFGLAHVEGLSSLTMTGQLSGTPHYIAPELASKQQKAADYQTDIYALGVTLYELLTFTRPFEGRTSQEILDNIVSREPSSPRVHNTLIPRDLETICMTAVEKSRSHRYSSAGEFGDDILSFLAFKPIKAQPAGLGTHVYRLARRNPAYTTIFGLLFLLVVVGPLIFGIQQKLSGDRIRKALREKEDALAAKDHALTEKDHALKVAGQERDAKEVALKQKEDALKQAGQEAATAKQVSDFLTGVFRGGDPFFSYGEKLTAYDLLQRGSASIATELTGQFEVQVRLMGIIGASYKSIGYCHEAEPLLKKALEICRSELGEAHELTVMACYDLADLYLLQERNAEAGPLLTTALAQVQVMHGDETKPYLDELECGIMELLGQNYLLEGHFEEAEQIFNQIIAKVQGDSRIGAHDLRMKNAMSNLGNIYAKRGQLEDAESILLRTQEASSEECRCGRCEYTRLTSATALGNLYARMGKFDEAKRHLLNSYEQTLRFLGEDHFLTHHKAMSVANLYYIMNRLEESEALLLKSIQGFRTILGDESPSAIRASALLAELYVKQARFEEAETLLIDCIDKSRRNERASLPDGFRSPSDYTMNDLEDLQSWMADESSQSTPALGLDISNASIRLTIVLRDQLRDLYAMQGRHKEVVALYEQAVEENRIAFGEDSPAELNSLHNLANALISTSRYEEAAKIIARILHEYPTGHPACLRLCVVLHSLKNNQGQENIT